MAPLRVVVLLAAFVSRGAADFEAPKFTLDLDRSPRDRWQHMMATQLERHGWDYT